MSEFSFIPESASTFAAQVDALFWLLVAVTAFFTTVISAAVLYFAIKYRRSKSPVAEPARSTLALEVTWSVIPLCIALFIFAWGADVFMHMNTPPAETLDIYVTGKQWMWKIQHPEGKREINDLHIPVGTPVKLTMTSEDTIHSFFIPAFRTKMDVLPGRYTTQWFQATRTGEYHLFCTEYCGTKHSEMIGTVYVMEPEAYDAWVAGGVAGLTAAEAGEQLFQGLGCATCHSPQSGARGPHLLGKYGTEQALEGGRTALFDEEYTRESILNPRAKVVSGYQPVMPSFQGQISEENLLRLIAYIKSIGADTASGEETE
ncbi:MAG TPA: cytochrome c oxidase subunit II [Acidobacteriota bacterium]|nr:cytochrome c oxidase subunit II [Acidobacteriota bacterium]